jgi:hypothetical protein
MTGLGYARNGKSAAQVWHLFTASSLCIAALGLAGCEKAEPQASDQAAAASSPTPVSQVSDRQPVTQVYDLSNQLGGGADEIAIPSSDGNLGLHIVCKGGQTKVMLVAPRHLTSDDEVVVYERFGNGPEGHVSWLTGTNQSSLIFNNRNDTNDVASWTQLLLLFRAGTYTVRLDLPGRDTLQEQFNTAALRNALQSHSADCDWGRVVSPAS